MTTYRLCGGCGGLRMVSSPIRVNLDYVEIGDDTTDDCRCECPDIPTREEEIEEFLERLGDVWRGNPDIRLGRLIEAVIECESRAGALHLFYVEDEMLLGKLEEAWDRR